MSQLPNMPLLTSSATKLYLMYRFEDLHAIVNNKIVLLLAGFVALIICISLMMSSPRSRPGRTRSSTLMAAGAETAVRKPVDSSVYPPGMQFDVVQKRWARRGLDPPFPADAAA